MSDIQDDILNYSELQCTINNAPCTLHPDHQTLEAPASESSKTEELSADNVLNPDNPLLERFQQTLKQHLLQHIERLKDEIFGDEIDLKKTETLKGELGVQVYNEQQSLDKQQKIVDNLMNQLATTKAAYEETEHILNERKAIHKTEHARILKAEAEENETRRKIENFTFLNKKLTQWEEQLESNLTIKHRIIEKTEKEKLQLLDEKRVQDKFIYNLMTKIWHFEQQLEQIDMQIKIKTDERDEMAEIIFHGNIQIETIQSEYRAILHSWNTLLTTMSQRNRTMNCLKDELMGIEEQLKTIMNETDKTRKCCTKEMQNNEKLTDFNRQIVKNNRHIETITNKENDKRTIIENEIGEMQMIIEQIENDIGKIRNETKIKQEIQQRCARIADKLQNDKNHLDETILKRLEDQIVTDQITINLNRKLRQLRDNNQNNEINLIQLENKTIQVQTDIEIQRSSNDELQKLFKQIERKFNDLLKNNDESVEIVQRNQRILSRKQRDFDVLTTKLQKLLEKTGGEILSPIQMKMKELDGQMGDVQEEIKELQNLWLREQVNVLQLSKDRQEQIHKDNLLNKQIMLMEQKNLRITDQLEDYVCKEQALQRNLNLFHNRLAILNEHLFKTKDTKDDLTQMNELLRKDYLVRLQDTEYECLNLQDDIQQIDTDIKQFNYDLIHLNREILEWEKQYKVTKEIKENFNKEKSLEGEIGGMKAEIHRMTVRYSQLRKAQDRLIHDLENCVSRRDAIITGAEAREKRSKGGLEHTRIHFQRKLDNMKNKIKQMDNEIRVNVERKATLAMERCKLSDDTRQLLQNELVTNQEQIDELTDRIEDVTIKCRLSFELLLQLQHKLSMYNDLLSGKRLSLLYRTKSGLIKALSRQQQMNTNLLDIVEMNLLVECPHLRHRLKPLINTLKTPRFLTDDAI